MLRKTKNFQGFALIEALTVLFIFVLITTTFYYVLSAGLHYIQDAKNRLGALAIANEKMEAVRNLAYEDIGTDTGTVEGDLPEFETVSENSRNYDIHYFIEYVQDDFDGISPDDDAWEDYKKVTITVSWNEGIGVKSVELASRFVPQGLEVANPGDGILSVNVFSDQPGGTGIDYSKVTIVNTETGLNTYGYTDSTGNITFMGDRVTDSIQKYEITIEKSGYETVTTFPPYPDTSYNPVDVHASVVAGNLNVANIVQNELVNLSVSTIDYLNNSIPDINFNLEGGRKMGNVVEIVNEVPVITSEVVYNLDSNTSTNSSGQKDFGEVSPGTYTFTLSDSNYEIIETSPVNPFPLYSSDESLNFKIKLAPKNATSILITVKNNSDNSIISGAQVKMTNASGYDITQTTNAEGKVFFPTTSDVFASGDYNIQITADGFNSSDSTTTINENELKTEEIKLTPSL